MDDMTSRSHQRDIPRQDRDILVEAYDLSCHYNLASDWASRMLRGEKPRRLKAVDGVDFEIPRGRTFGLVGESGCGKSTIAKLAVGLLQPTRGIVRYAGKDIHNLPRDGGIQMIFQDPSASLDPRWKVDDIIGEPLRARGDADKGRIRYRVDELLNQVGFTPADGTRFPHEFSGGQRQRISIARALASNPKFLVCDEPTSALDVSVQAQILNLMRDLQSELGLTYLFISHNLAVIRQMADAVGVMYLGNLVETAPTDSLFRQPRHPYTRMLIDAIPRIDSFGKVRPRPLGDVASPLAPPSGCAFHPRCPSAMSACSIETPRRLVLTDDKDRSAACHVIHGSADGTFPREEALA
jgi:peptide/nickel transport system ATP-binding protein